VSRSLQLPNAANCHKAFDDGHRRTDAVAALARIGAKALFTCSRVGTFNHGQHATAVAADVFSIRYVCGFGNNLPDGVVSFDDLFKGGTDDAFTGPITGLHPISEWSRQLHTLYGSVADT